MATWLQYICAFSKQQDFIVIDNPQENVNYLPLQGVTY